MPGAWGLALGVTGAWGLALAAEPQGLPGSVPFVLEAAIAEGVMQLG